MKDAKFVIWDLDGTIVDTDALCVEAATEVFSRFGKRLTPELKASIVGTRPLDLYTYLVEVLAVPERPEALLELSQELLENRFEQASLMPGVLRLLSHFHKNEIPMALATSTDKINIPKKLKGKEYILEFFKQVLGGDEVAQGKPHPDLFLLAAQRLGAEPEECIVFEDSVVGVKAAISAGMQVIFIPSLPGLDLKDLKGNNHVSSLKSLMDFNPAEYGLPGLTGSIQGVIRMDPIISLNGTVVKGFGRGARELGIRTANIDEQSLSDKLSTTVTGIYAGWASLGSDQTIYKMVMSIGWNPFYKNKKKTAEAWLLHEFDEDFYGEDLRLIVCGYLRPEADFTSLEELKTQIHQDAKLAEVFLEAPSIMAFKTDPSLSTIIQTL